MMIDAALKVEIDFWFLFWNDGFFLYYWPSYWM